jgi:hypothetical protein
VPRISFFYGIAIYAGCAASIDMEGQLIAG